jgi:5-methylthioadenosine/S-adenosylhomocysteine deaminase
MDGREVLKMATFNCKYVLGNYNFDTLEEGKLADIIMIDLSKPNMQPINNIEKNIVYSGSKENIKMTMINGKILYMNGEFFIDENVDELYKKAQEITDRLIKEGEETLKRK